MGTPQLTFAKAVLASLAPPSTGRCYYRDDKTRGLVLDVSAVGTKTFQLYRKVNGKPTRVALGRFDPDLPDSRELPRDSDLLALVGNTPSLNVRMARKLADAVNASIDRGVNPASAARQLRLASSKELTLREAFNRYHDDYLVPHGKRTVEGICNDFARYLGKVPPGQKKLRGKEKVKSKGAVDWEQRKLSSIKQSDIRMLMAKLKENIGPRTANKTYVLLRSIYNKVIAWQLYSGSNPCAGIEKFKEHERERFVKGDELPRFLGQLDLVEHQSFKDFEVA